MCESQGGEGGISMCEGLAVPERARIGAGKGAELIIAPYGVPAGYVSAEHNTEHTSAPDVAGEEFLDRERWTRWWDSLMQTRAYENVAYLAAVNHVGQEGMAILYGGTKLVGPDGETVGKAGQWDDVIVGALDREQFARVGRTTPSLGVRRRALQRIAVHVLHGPLARRLRVSHVPGGLRSGASGALIIIPLDAVRCPLRAVGGFLEALGRFPGQRRIWA